MNLEIKSTSSPQDSYSLKALKSFNVFLNNSVSAWCRRKQRPGGWVTLDLGADRTISALTTSGYPVGTEPGFKNFTLQMSGLDIVYLNYTEDTKTKVCTYYQIFDSKQKYFKMVVLNHKTKAAEVKLVFKCSVVTII